MIYVNFILLLAFLSCSYKSETIAKDKEYTDVILTYKDSILGGCGNLALAYRFKFRNVENDRSLTCIIRCPDTYADGFFEEGKSYKVKLSNINIQDSIIVYSYVKTFVNDNDSDYLVIKIKNAITKIKNTVCFCRFIRYFSSVLF